MLCRAEPPCPGIGPPSAGQDLSSPFLSLVSLRCVPDALAALARAVDPSGLRPCLAPDVEVVRFESRGRGGHAVLRNPRTSTYLRLSGSQADLAVSFDGTRTAGEISGAASGEVDELVALLHRRGFLTTPWIDTYALLAERTASPPSRVLGRAWRRLRTLTIPFPGAPGAVDAIYAAGGRFAFTPLAQAGLVAVAAAGGMAFAAGSRSARFGLLDQPPPAASAALVVLVLAGIFLHELGHALAVRHAGRRIRAAGFQLYAAHPAFFVDSSDMVMVGRRPRVVNAVAGLCVDAVMAGAAACGALAIGSAGAVAGEWGPGDVLFRFAGLTYVFMLVNLVPFLELDGYWLLTDLLDLPDLRPRALEFLRHRLPDLIRARRPLTGGEWGLLLFGVAGVATLGGALVVSWLVWLPVVRSLATGLWRAGPGGQLLAVTLAAVVVAPLVHGLSDGFRRARRRARTGLAAVRFRAQRRWRVEAGTMIEALAGDGALPAEALNDVAGRVRRQRFGRGRTIARGGEAAAFFIVRRGRCVVVDDGPGGDGSVIGHLAAGDVFGGVALTAGTPHVATVRAESAVEVFMVDGATFRRLRLDVRAGPPSSSEVVPRHWAATRISALSPFRALDHAAAAQVAAASTWVDVAPGVTLADDRVYVVERGQLVVEGARGVATPFGPGDRFRADAGIVRTVTRAVLLASSEAAVVPNPARP
ncbi:MAG: putative peptide zinc metalloprotease protein [Actinomycetota bacterium]|nr:putative peptide zinc metalloprotease protein [Actinomycetota bacterium]